MFQMFEVGPWSDVDTNGDGEIDTIETRNAARKVSGLTPLSEEVRTIDSVLDAERGPQRQGSAHRRSHVQRRAGDRAQHVDRRHVHLQAHEQHVRQYADQQGDRPGVGVRADTVRDVIRPAA